MGIRGIGAPRQTPRITHGPATWRRNLGIDLDAIRDWGAVATVTLVEEHELRALKVPDLGTSGAWRTFNVIQASTETGVWIKYDGPRLTSSKITILRYIAGSPAADNQSASSFRSSARKSRGGNVRRTSAVRSAIVFTAMLTR